jgi:hypothetical protein
MRKQKVWPKGRREEIPQRIQLPTYQRTFSPSLLQISSPLLEILFLSSHIMSRRRRLTRTYGVENLESTEEVMAATAREQNWAELNPAAPVSSSSEAAVASPEAAVTSPEAAVASPEAAVASPEAGIVSSDDDDIEATTGPASSFGAAKTHDPIPVMVRGKVLSQRSPLPGRTNRNTHPGLIDMPKTKRTRAEVTTAANRKAAIQRQVDELERQHIEALAEMEVQEELDDDTNENSLIRNLIDDDTEDVNMGSTDGKAIDAPSGSEVFEDDEESAESQVALNPTKVRCIPSRRP